MSATQSSLAVLVNGTTEAAIEAMKAGETKLAIHVTREFPHREGTRASHFVVEGFACAQESCPEPWHVLVYSVQAEQKISPSGTELR